MAFTDRVVEHPGRVTLTPVTGQTNVYDMTRNEGEIYADGTLLNATNMNQQTQLDNAVETLYTTAGMTGGTYQNEVSDALAYVVDKITPNFMQVAMTSDQTLTNQSTTVLNFNSTTRSAGNKLTLNTTNHRIIIGAGVKYVRVSGQIYIYTVGSNGAKNAYIYQNEAIKSRGVANLTSSYNTIVVPPIILDVVQNDYFTLRAQSQAGTTTAISRESYTTFLLVEVIG